MIAGIDLSTKAVEIVRRDDDCTMAWWEHIAFETPPNMKERDALCARELRDIFPRGEFWDGVWLCGVEYPFTVNGPALGLKTVLGAIVALIPSHVHVIPLAATFWQKRFCTQVEKMPRKGVDRKPLIKERALEILAGHGNLFDKTGSAPFDWAQDAYDAFGVSVIVEGVNDGSIR